ncbi:MAG: hypothetical protein ACFFA3_02515 [Promethearchaeota archaeon]
MKSKQFLLKTLLIFSLFPLIINPVNLNPTEARSPNIAANSEWVSIWSIFDNKNEVSIDVDVDSNDDVIMGGYVINSSVDYFVTKYDENGVQLWNDTRDGGSQDWFRALTVSGTDIYVGIDFYNQTRYECFLGKFDVSGNHLWNISWFKTGASGCYTRDLALSQAGDFYFTGEMAYGFSPSYTYQYFIVKLNFAGNEVWNMTFGVKNETRKTIHGIATFNDIIYLVGQERNYTRSENDPLIICVNATNGYQLWNKSWTVQDYNEGRATDVIVDSSGNFYVSGYYGAMFNTEVFLRKYNPSSDLIWEETYKDISSKAQGIALEDNSNIYISGSTEEDFSGSSALLLKYASNGSLLGEGSWKRDTTSGQNYGHNVEVDSSGNVYMVGVTPGIIGTDAFIIKNLELLKPRSGGKDNVIPSFNSWIIMAILGCSILLVMKKNHLKNKQT